MALIEDMVKYCITSVLEECPAEMEFFNKMIDTSLLERLNHVVNSKFEVMTYTDAIETLKQLKELYEAGVLTEEEYNAKRQKYVSKI